MFAKIIKFQLFTRGPHVFARECKGTVVYADEYKGGPLVRTSPSIWKTVYLGTLSGLICPYGFIQNTLERKFVELEIF